MKKVILITGTSSGFGKLTATAMLEAGHQVYATMRDISCQSADELRTLGANVLTLDVTDNNSIQQAFDIISAKEKSLDVIVNNAGIAAAGISESFDVSQVQSMFDVNVMGALRVTQAALPIMRKQQDGLIINIGSILGRVTFPFFGLYGASKYAVEAMTDSLSYELSQLGIDVALIQPSAYPTNMYGSALTPAHENIIQQYGDIANIPSAISDNLAAMFSAEDAPNPIDIANAVVALIGQKKGQRNKRTVVGASFGADAANEQIAPIQSGLMAALELSALEKLKV